MATTSASNEENLLILEDTNNIEDSLIFDDMIVNDDIMTSTSEDMIVFDDIQETITESDDSIITLESDEGGVINELSEMDLSLDAEEITLDMSDIEEKEELSLDMSDLGDEGSDIPMELIDEPMTSENTEIVEDSTNLFGADDDSSTPVASQNDLGSVEDILLTAINQLEAKEIAIEETKQANQGKLETLNTQVKTLKADIKQEEADLENIASHKKQLETMKAA